MARENVKSYIKNLGKSLAYSALSTLQAEMPALSNTITANSDVVKSGINYTKDFIQKKKTGANLIDALLGKYVDDLKEIKANAFEDLRTGNFRNQDRGVESFKKSMQLDFDIDWGLGDDLDFNAEDSDVDSDSSSENLTVNAIRNSAKINEEGSNMRTRSIMDTVISVSEEATKQTIRTNTKLQSLSMGMQAQMHTEVVKLMSNTNELLSSLFEFHNNTMVAHMDKQLSFYDNVLLELREIKESFTSGKNARDQQYRQRTSPFDEIFGREGSINFANYGKQIKQNVNNMISMSGLGMLTAMGSLVGGGPLDLIKSSPLSLITDFLVANIMPKSLKLAAGKLDASLSGLLGAMIMKMTKAKDSMNNPAASFFSSIFGVDIDNKNKIDVSNYFKGAVPYSGKSDKALTEVIPTLLSHILSAVRGGDGSNVPIFDYRNGRFVDTKSVISSNEERIKYSRQSSMGDIRRSMKRSLESVPGGSNEKITADLDNFIDFLAQYNGLYNPLKDTDVQRLTANGLKLNDPRVYGTLRAAFLSMPKHLQSSAAWRQLAAKSNVLQTYNSIEEELSESGLASAYNGLSGFYPNKPDTTTPPTNLNNHNTPQQPQTGHDFYTDWSNGNAQSNEIENLIRMPFEAMRTTMTAFNQMDGMTKNTAPSSGFFKDLMAEKSMSKRVQMIRNKIGTPGQLITGMIGKLDTMIYRIIYGTEDGKSDTSSSSGGNSDDGDHPPGKKKSIIGTFTNIFHKAMGKSMDFIDNRVFMPFHEKFFGEHGIFAKIGDELKPLTSSLRGKAKDRLSKITGYLMGAKKDGVYSGGALSEFGNVFIDTGRAVKAMFTGKSYKKSDGTEVSVDPKESIFKYMKTYASSILDVVKTGLFGEKESTVDENGNVTYKRKGTGLFNNLMDSIKETATSLFSLFSSKEGEIPDENKKVIIDWSNEFKGFLPKGTASAIMGMGVGALLPGGPIIGGMLGVVTAFAAHSKKFRNYLFGDEENGQKGLIPKKYVDMFKQYVPSTIAGTLLGTAAGAFLPGAPLMAPLLGATLGYVKKSKKAQEFLFGTEEGKEGVVPKKWVDGFKKYASSIAGGGTLGLLLGSAIGLPPTISLALGAAMGFAKKSSRVQEYLFGKEADENGKGATKGLLGKKFKERLTKITGGSVIGGIASTLFTGSPVLGAILGATLGYVGKTKRFQEIIFGKEDEDGKKKGGLLNFAKKHSFGLLGGILGSLGVLPGGELGGLLMGWALKFILKGNKLKERLMGKSKNKDGKDDEKEEQSNLFTFVKKHFPTLLGGAVGISGLLGFGLIPGLAIGGIAKFLSKGDRLSKLLFGKEDKDGEPKHGLLPAIKKHWPTLAGMLVGAVGGPFGIVGGALIGTIAKFIGKTKKFQRFIFGDDEKNEKDEGKTTKKGGIFSRFISLFKRHNKSIDTDEDVGLEDGDSEENKKAVRKSSGFFRNIGRAMRRFTTNIRKGLLSRLSFLSKTIETVHDKESYDATMLGLTHQIAANTTGMSTSGKTNGGSDNNDKSSIFDMIKGLFTGFNSFKSLLSGAGLLTTGIAAAALIKDITEGDTAGAAKTIARFATTKIGQPLLKAGIATAKVGGKIAAATVSGISKLATKTGLTAVTKSLASKSVAKVSQVVTKAAATPAGSKIISLITRIFQHPTITKIFGKLGKVISKNLPRISKSITNAITKTGPSIASKLLKNFNLIATIAFLAYDLTTGMLDARTIFQIPATVDVSFGMRLAAGLGKMISGQLTFGLIPASLFANIIYELIASDEDSELLKEQQETLKNDLAIYNQQNGTMLTLDEYNEKVENPSTFTKIKNWITGKSTKVDTSSNIGDAAVPNITIKAVDASSILNNSVPNTNGSPIFNIPSTSSKNDYSAGASISGITIKAVDPSTIPNGGVQNTDSAGISFRLPSRSDYDYDATSYLTTSALNAINAKELTDSQLSNEFKYVLSAKSSDVDVDDLRMVQKLCTQYGLNTHLWWAMVELESSFNSKAVNSIGAAGWGQVIPSTGKWLYTTVLKLGTTYNHATMGINKLINARMSIYYLSSLIKDEKGNIRKALQRYNGNASGTKYSNIVESNLRRNTGMLFSDIINPKGTGINTVNNAEYAVNTGSSGSTGVLGFIASLGTGISGILPSLFKFNLSDLSSAVTETFSMLDPFAGKYISPTDSVSSDLNNQGVEDYKKSQGSKYSSLSGDLDIHDFVAQRLSKLAKSRGKSIYLTSGFRSDSEQAKEVENWYSRNNKDPNNTDDVKERKKWVADPGESLHGLGLVADVGSEWVKNLTNKQLAEFGLWKPAANEDWHVEPIETAKLGRKRPYLDQLFGTPVNPSSSMSSNIDSKYNSTEDIGDAATPDTITGAPNASGYLSRISTVVNKFNNGMYTKFEEETLKLLQLIAQGIQSVVGLNADTKQLLTQYLASRSTNNKSNNPDIAIVPIQESTKSNNPFTNMAANNKQNKSKTMMAIAGGTYS